MLKQRLHELPVRPEWIERVSENRHLTLALIEQVGKIVALARHEDAATAESLATRTLRHSLEALGLSPDYLVTGDAPPLAYRPEMLNPSLDLAALTLPLLQKTASDLLNCYLGETEKNLAAMFRGD